MHQYMQWIIQNKPDVLTKNTDKTYKQVLQEFLEKIERNSHPYKRVFAKFFAGRHNNHSYSAMADFVSEVEHQMNLYSLRANINFTQI